MRDDEIKTLQQLIRSFNLGYYDAEIREIEKQIESYVNRKRSVDENHHYHPKL